MNDDVLNLTFHGVGEPNRALETGEEDVWIPVGLLRDVLDVAVGHAPLRLTFDDGNRSDLAVALRELVRRRMKAIFFVVAGRIGQRGFLGEPELKELIAAGMEVGSHGMDHRPWRKMGTADLSREIESARAVIERCIAGPVTKAACPFGSYGRRVLGRLRAAGFQTVYTSDRGWTSHDAWLQPRNTLRRDDASTAMQQLLAQDSSFRWLLRDLKMILKRWR